MAARCNRDYRIGREPLADDIPNSTNHFVKGIIILPKPRSGIVRLPVTTIRLNKIPLCAVRGECTTLHCCNIARQSTGKVPPIFCNYAVM